MFLAGPPLVKMATGEESDDESLGGAEMHARHLRPCRLLRRRRAGRDPASAARSSRGSTGASTARPPTPVAGPPALRRGGAARHRPDRPQGARSTRARSSPGSSTARDFDEFKPLYGSSLVTGWAELHGYPVGILANARGVLFSEEAQKAAQFIQLANRADTPLLFLQNTTGYMVGKEYEQARHHQARRADDQRGVQLDGAAPDGDDGRLVRRRQLRHVRTRLRAAVPVHLAEREVGGDGPGAARRRAVDRGAAGGRGARAGLRRGRPTRRCAPYVEEQIEAAVAARRSCPAGSTTTASSTRATPAPCSASRCRPCTARRSRAPAATGCSGCEHPDDHSSPSLPHASRGPR